MEPSTGRILVVDDTRANLDVLCELLEGEGYSVSLAPNGEIALRIASRTVPDLILLDFLMPYPDGFQVCRYPKGLPCFRHTPIFALTGLTSPRDRERIAASGVDAYFAKPVNYAELVPAIRAAVARSSSPAAPKAEPCR